MKFKKLNQLSKIEMGSLIGGAQPGDTRSGTSSCSTKLSSDKFSEQYSEVGVRKAGQPIQYDWVITTYSADYTDHCACNTTITYSSAFKESASIAS